jgi:CRP/FNR family transcriptional regulator, cyclic AMP receptor protein
VSAALTQITPSRGAVRPFTASHRETIAPRVSVLGADPGLTEAVPAADLPRARRAIWASAVTFAGGPVDLTAASLSSTAFALLIIKGVLTRQTGLSDRAMIELLLTGDVLSPWPATPTAPLTETRLTALDEVRLVVLDHRFVKAAAIWPGLMIAIQQRLDGQQRRLATHGAICQLPRVEQRVLAVMWLLAARTGTVTAQGTELSFALTHDALARLTGSRRPTVSLAVKRLRERGYLDRRDNGAWLLPQAPAALVFDDLIANLSEV